MWFRILIFGASVAALCAAFFGAFVQYGDGSVTRVVFLDVGQGDAILISRGTHQILIDGGASERVLLEKLGAHMPFWDRSIEVMIATHPDADHIAGQIGVFGAFRVHTVIATDAFKKSSIATAWHSALLRSGAQVIDANESVIVRLAEGDDAAGVLKVLFPRAATNVPAITDINDTSVVTHVKVGETTFLMTGDLSKEQERNIKVPPVSVLKVGHHGSRTSSGEEFIARITPRDAVISVGADNRYGHPTQEVLERLYTHGADVVRTDEVGDIVYECEEQSGFVCTRTTR